MSKKSNGGTILWEVAGAGTLAILLIGAVLFIKDCRGNPQTTDEKLEKTEEKLHAAEAELKELRSKLAKVDDNHSTEVKVAPKVESQGKISSTTSNVIGDADKASVSATIRRRMPGLEACYEKALRSNPKLRGKLTYTITLSPSGRVTEVKIDEDTVGDSSVRSCTEAKITGWRFVIEGAEENSEVTFSVAFTG